MASDSRLACSPESLLEDPDSTCNQHAAHTHTHTAVYTHTHRTHAAHERTPHTRSGSGSRITKRRTQVRSWPAVLPNARVDCGVTCRRCPRRARPAPEDHTSL